VEAVTVQLSNIQSHENTKFTLKPGLNFILAEDNNVGKSTIFKVLTAVAKAPRVSVPKLRALMRVGCLSAYAAFAYSDGQVVAWLKRENEKATPKMFFEHTFDDGSVMRGMSCPTSLLDALGIVLDEDGEVINFNDADSVQLISKVSTEADKVLTHVILDARVELIKDNMVKFYRELESDERIVGARLEEAQAQVKKLDYNPLVDEFFNQEDELYALCRACDTLECIGHFEFLGRPGIDEAAQFVDEYRPIVQLISDLSEVDFDLLGKDLSIGDDLIMCASILRKFADIDWDMLAGNAFTRANLENMRKMRSCILKLRDAVEAINRLEKLQRECAKKEQELASLKRELEKLMPTVECPVKGKVLYSDEGCVPCSD